MRSGRTSLSTKRPGEPQDRSRPHFAVLHSCRGLCGTAGLRHGAKCAAPIMLPAQGGHALGPVHRQLESAAMTMAAIAPCGQRSRSHRGGAMNVTGRLRGHIGGVPSCDRRQERPGGRLTRAIRWIPLASPTMVVSGMAHSTAAPAKGEKRQRADTNYQPDPIAAKPVHSCVPSLTGPVCAHPAGAPATSVRHGHR